MALRLVVLSFKAFGEYLVDKLYLPWHLQVRFIASHNTLNKGKFCGR